MTETLAFGHHQSKDKAWELGTLVRDYMCKQKGFVSVAAEGYEAPGVVVVHTDDAATAAKFTKIGTQIAAGVRFILRHISYQINQILTTFPPHSLPRIPFAHLPRCHFSWVNHPIQKRFASDCLDWTNCEIQSRPCHFCDNPLMMPTYNGGSEVAITTRLFVYVEPSVCLCCTLFPCLLFLFFSVHLFFYSNTNNDKNNNK